MNSSPRLSMAQCIYVMIHIRTTDTSIEFIHMFPLSPSFHGLIKAIAGRGIISGGNGLIYIVEPTSSGTTTYHPLRVDNPVELDNGVDRLFVYQTNLSNKL